MEEKILNFILECAEVQKLVPFSLIEEEFNLISGRSLKVGHYGCSLDNDTISSTLTSKESDGFTVHIFRELIVNIQTNQLMTRTQPEA